jgi:hypothetical protein
VGSSVDFYSQFENRYFALAQVALLVSRMRHVRAHRKPHSVNAFPFSGTITLVRLPCMAATNFSAVGSMIGKLP